jgi:hypothetical protein
MTFDWKRLSNFFFLLSPALLISASAMAIGLRSSAAQKPGSLRPREEFTSIGEIPSARMTQLAVVLENRSDRMVKIVGAARICTPQCCVSVQDLPLEIPAHSDKPIQIQIFPGRFAGDFHCPVTLYTNEQGLNQMKLEICGRFVR